MCIPAFINTTFNFLIVPAESSGEELIPALAEAGVAFVPAPPEIGMLRSCKDANEVAAIQDACRIADAALEELIPLLRPGVSELEIKV